MAPTPCTITTVYLPIAGSGSLRILVPRGAKLLRVFEEAGQAALHMLAATADGSTEERLIHIVSPGGNVPDGAVYLDSVKFSFAIFPFHVFVDSAARMEAGWEEPKPAPATVPAPTKKGSR